MESEHIIWFKDLTIKDVTAVGGKNAALGEMVANLIPLGVSVPDGFAVTAKAYDYFISEAGLTEKIQDILKGLDTRNVPELQRCGKEIRALIVSASFPDDLAKAITDAYETLCKRYGKNTDVAVRSSATAEDLPGASFAGQQETFLNVVGPEDVIDKTKRCFASLFTDRAISYRVDKGFAHDDVSLSVGVQKMVRSDVGASGVMFSIDTETGFDKVVVIDASYGLGEMVVQGKVTPDSFIVFKPSLEAGFDGIIAKDMGSKDVKMVYGDTGGVIVPVPQPDRDTYAISDDDIRTLAKWALIIEKHFSAYHGHYQPMDMEWAKDGKTGELFIVQARPETIHSMSDKTLYKEYRLSKKGTLLASGSSVGAKIATGKVRVIKDVSEINSFEEGEVLVTQITDPDWEPIMKIASAIVTDKGGRTSHAAIVSRELGIPCIVGTENATTVLRTGMMVTVDCSNSKEGAIYEGVIPFEILEHNLANIPETRTAVTVNIGSPDEAFKNHYLPVKGVGLGRLEFIINSHIGVHPNALINFDSLASNSKHAALVEKITLLTRGYRDKREYYVSELAEGIAKIGAAFYPHKVIIRFSDFKTNEYRTLLGGELYEPEEQNPMIGWRGASRYYDEKFRAAFMLECEAIKRVREKMGLSNVMVMIPFCRTPQEGKEVLQVMADAGLVRGEGSNLEVYVMCEIPSNVLQADAFLDIFDGMSIGSNDLTQLALGMDRDSDIISHIANENNDTVKSLIRMVIHACKARGKYVGICGQAPSDFPDFTKFLVTEGIDTVSLSPDTVIKTLPIIAEQERN